MVSISIRERAEAWLVNTGVMVCMRWPFALSLISRYIDWRNARVRRNHKCVWRCYRDGGGGQLITPRPMTERRAMQWVQRTSGGEVWHVDFDHRMIFYRSAGQMRVTD